MDSEIHVKFQTQIKKSNNEKTIIDEGKLVFDVLDIMAEDIKEEALRKSPIEVNYDYTIDYNLEDNMTSEEIATQMIDNYKSLYSHNSEDFLMKVKIHYKSLYEINRIIASFIYGADYKKIYKKYDGSDKFVPSFEYPDSLKNTPKEFFKLNK